MDQIWAFGRHKLGLLILLTINVEFRMTQLLLNFCETTV